MEFIAIKETCLYVHDLERARAFYEEVLGLRVVHHLEGKHLFLHVGNSVLLLFNPEDSAQKKSPPPHYAYGKQHFAFEVSIGKYEESKRELQRKGVVITDEVTWKSGKKSFYFNDPEGNVLEIVPDVGVWD